MNLAGNDKNWKAEVQGSVITWQETGGWLETGSSCEGMQNKQS